MIYLLIAVAGLVVGFLVLWFRPAFFASIVFINQWPTEVETVEAHGFRERLRTGALAEGEHSINALSIFGATSLPPQIELVWRDVGEPEERRCSVSLDGIPKTARSGMMMLKRITLETWKAEYRPTLDIEELLSYHPN
jgi:hypothetical protein